MIRRLTLLDHVNGHLGGEDFEGIECDRVVVRYSLVLTDLLSEIVAESVELAVNEEHLSDVGGVHVDEDVRQINCLFEEVSELDLFHLDGPELTAGQVHEFVLVELGQALVDLVNSLLGSGFELVQLLFVLGVHCHTELDYIN